ncbi:MAG: hypothetical protein FJY07_12315 [Bacteroidetes bacterium]|nr:hypothetical protein [Bacteroidota bacterium]
MIKKTFVTGLLAAIVILQCACKKNTDEATLKHVFQISNPSFEINNNPSLDGWSANNSSIFSNDVPPGGGNWSIMLSADWDPENYVQTSVHLDGGAYRYKLSTWAKKQGEGGAVCLLLNNAYRKSIAVTDTTWNIYTITDTISASAGDNLTIELWGGYSQLSMGTTFFDLCTLQKLD